MHDIDDLQMLRQQAPDVPPPSEQVRARARASLAQAMDAEARTRTPSRERALRRRLWRLAPAAGLAAVILATVVGGIGPAPAPDPTGETPAAPGLLGPDVVQAVEGDGYTDVRFLDPTADPERIRAELQALGIDLGITFVPADPFSVGRMVFSEGDEGIELLGETGSELEGGPIGIRVPDGWSGSGNMAIGRAAEDGETFMTSIPLNAERPGGPLHCQNVRGMSPAQAAEVVRGLGLQVEWRTTIDDHTSADEPPADFVVEDVIWSAQDTVILFAEAGPARPLSEETAALLAEGCDEDAR